MSRVIHKLKILKTIDTNMKKVLEEDTLKLVSLNIELAKHLDLVRAFLEKEKPDIACLQEVHEADLKDFSKELEMEAAFGPMSLIGRGLEYTKPPFTPYGVGILSALPFQTVQLMYYRGDEERAKKHVFDGTSRDAPHILLHVNVKKGSASFTIGTTHFMWTPDGNANDLQRRDLRSLFAILRQIPDIVLCGDFNAPRGKEIFNAIAERYKDNIPEHYTASIDVDLHRWGDRLRGEPLMVDGLFTTPQYRCSNVHLVGGVSDHLAIVAEVRRN